MIIKETLKTLCLAPSVSGSEAGARAALEKCLADTALQVESDALGNFVAVLNPNGSPAVMLEAHLDKIGFIVTGIDEKTGFLRIDKVGGIDARVCPAQRVNVYGKKELKGVIISTPPHLSKGDAKKVTPVNELAIDCGLSYDEIKDIVSLGDRAMISADFYELNQNIVCAPYVDDAAGAAAIIAAAKILIEKGTNARIELVFSSREEVGGMGAKTAAFACAAEYGIAVDVSFGTAPGVKEEHSAPLGSGVMIGTSPVLQKKVYDMLKTAAEENAIPHTTEVLGRSTGTDADDIVISKTGKLTGLLSIPIRNMHTPVEIVDLRDIESTAKLIAEFTKKL